jgi:hypothetical protein
VYVYHDVVEYDPEDAEEESPEDRNRRARTERERDQSRYNRLADAHGNYAGRRREKVREVGSEREREREGGGEREREFLERERDRGGMGGRKGGIRMLRGQVPKVKRCDEAERDGAERGGAQSDGVDEAECIAPWNRLRPWSPRVRRKREVSGVVV